MFISYYEQDNLNLIINLSNFLKLCLIASNWKSTNSRKIQSIYYYSFSVLMFSIIQVIEWTFGRKKKMCRKLTFPLGGLGTKPWKNLFSCFLSFTDISGNLLTFNNVNSPLNSEQTNVLAPSLVSLVHGVVISYTKRLTDSKFLLAD